MFGEGVGQVGFTRSVIDQELALPDTVLEPVPAHVHGLGPFLLHGPVGETVGRGVVDLDRRGGLGMSQFLQRGAHWYSVLGVEIGSPDLGLGGGSHDYINDGAECVDGSIEGRDIDGGRGRIDGVVAEKVMTGSTAAGAGL